MERMRTAGLRTALSGVQGYIIEAHLSQHEEDEAEKLLRDWQRPAEQPKAWISKWQPGTHYYALDAKFETEAEAREHLRLNNYECLGVDVRYVYTKRGD